MANEKITDMTAIVTYADADLIEVVDVSEASAEDQNKKMTKAVLFDSAPDFGNGLSISDDEVLDTYDEGTWTPVGNGITLAVAAGVYTRIGNMVAINFTVTFPATGSGANAFFTGLPFDPVSNGGGKFSYQDASFTGSFRAQAGTGIVLYNEDGTQPINSAFSGKVVEGSCVYFV